MREVKVGQALWETLEWSKLHPLSHNRGDRVHWTERQPKRVVVGMKITYNPTQVVMSVRREFSVFPRYCGSAKNCSANEW